MIRSARSPHHIRNKEISDETLNNSRLTFLWGLKLVHPVLSWYDRPWICYFLLSDTGKPHFRWLKYDTRSTKFKAGGFKLVSVLNEFCLFV